LEHLLSDGPTPNQEGEKVTETTSGPQEVIEVNVEKTCECEHKDKCTVETKNYNLNVRLPCSNGQAYSVSQNKVLFLPPCKISDCMSTVKLRVNQLESQTGGLVSRPVSQQLPDTTGLVLNLTSQFEATKEVEPEELTTAALTKLPPPQLQAKLLKKEIWDPAEHKNALTENSAPPSATPSPKPKPDDPFSAQLDRVCIIFVLLEVFSHLSLTHEFKQIFHL
jgi:hypothetical protein